MTTNELMRKLRAGEVEPAEIEEIVSELAAYLPPRSELERNSLIRIFAKSFAPPELSRNEIVDWLSIEFSRFESGGDWKAWRNLAVCPNTGRRRGLMWKIRTGGALPKRTKLLEILNLEQ